MSWSNGLLRLAGFRRHGRRGPTTVRLELMALENRCAPAAVTAATDGPVRGGDAAGALVAVHRASVPPMGTAVPAAQAAPGTSQVIAVIFATSVADTQGSGDFAGPATAGSFQPAQPLVMLPQVPVAPFGWDDPSLGVSAPVTPNTPLSFGYDSGYAEPDGAGDQADMSQSPSASQAPYKPPADNATHTAPAAPDVGQGAGKPDSGGNAGGQSPPQ
jgi:hypothetical protein